MVNLLNFDHESDAQRVLSMTYEWSNTGKYTPHTHIHTHTHKCWGERQSLFQWTFLLSECLVCISHRLQWDSWIHSMRVHAGICMRAKAHKHTRHTAHTFTKTQQEDRRAKKALPTTVKTLKSLIKCS